MCICQTAGFDWLSSCYTETGSENSCADPPELGLGFRFKRLGFSAGSL